MSGLRMLTPLGWLAVVIVGVIALVLIGGGIGLRWDPFDMGERRLDRARADAALAASDAVARGEEAAGERLQSQRLETFQQRARAVDRITAAATNQARTADDASTPLDAARADRLRAHDRELCRLAPELVGCAAAAQPAASGGDALRDRSPA